MISRDGSRYICISRNKLGTIYLTLRGGGVSNVYFYKKNISISKDATQMSDMGRNVIYLTSQKTYPPPP